MKRILFLSLLLLCSLTLPAQKKNLTMKGVVAEESGDPLPGVTVYVKEKVTVGTSTNSRGEFTIRVTQGDILVFSAIGMDKVEELVLEEKQDMRIVLREAAAQIEEVTIMGGTQRKISSVAAVTSVDARQLQVPAPSVVNLLGGKVAGVITMQTSGEPGKNLAEFWVRGIGTFGASSGALVLVDGLEGDLNSLDPADIESFSVLKDASATAVYGVRGANGVVLVTTKKGVDGKLQIAGRMNFSLSQMTRLPRYIGAYEYASLVNEALEVRGNDPKYTELEMTIIRKGLDHDLYPDVNWQDEVLNPLSFKQTYYASARGGGAGETASYKVDPSSKYASNVGYNTYSYRLNININLSKSTDLYVGSDGHLAIRKQPGVANSDYIWWAQSMINPLMLPAVYSNGLYPAGSESAGMSSPYVMINQLGKGTQETYKGKATVAVNQDLGMIVEGLKFKIQGAYDLHAMHNQTRVVQPALYRAFERDRRGELIMNEVIKSSTATFSRGQNRFRKYHLETTLNYDHAFGNHRLSGLVYYYLSDQQATSGNNTSMTAIPVRYQGLSSRLTYNYRDTYMVDFNFGYTGSENFEPGRQYGFFPSIAVGWVPTSYEYTRRHLPWLDFFKIRGSYGTVGNDRLAGNRRFPYLTLLYSGTSGIWGSTGREEVVGEEVVGADNLVWEKAQKANLGVEMRLWKDRVSLVADIFSDMRDGIFQPRVQVPYYAGAVTNPYGNVGKMKSFGTDGNIEYREFLNKNMSFTVRANYTYSNNMVYNWEQLYEKYPYIERTGYPNGVHRGYRCVGFFRDLEEISSSPRQTFGTVEPGDLKYEDVNGDGRIDSEDRVPLSYSTYPLLMFGFGVEFRYKDFSVGVLMKGTGKTDYYRVGQGGNGMGYVPFHEGEAGNVITLAADPHNRWIPLDYAVKHGLDPSLAENPEAIFPRLRYGNNSNNSQLSDFWKGDSRYLRLQEVTLNYNMKNDFLRKWGIASLDIQLVGNNLYVWDKVKLFDPEQAQRNGQVYPIPAVYTLQLYINL